MFNVLALEHEIDVFVAVRHAVGDVEENFNGDAARVGGLLAQLPKANFLVCAHGEGLDLLLPLDYLARAQLGDVPAQHDPPQQVRVRDFVFVDLVDAFDDQRPAVEEQRQVEGEGEADELPGVVVGSVDGLGESHGVGFKVVDGDQLVGGTEVFRRFDADHRHPVLEDPLVDEEARDDVVGEDHLDVLLAHEDISQAQ